MKSKSLIYPLLAGVLLWAGCTRNFDEINTDPNNPREVPSSALMTNAQKSLMDDIRDEWFSGRQSYLYAQYFAQRTYTEEDRYQLRQTTNNTYWILIYNDLKDLQEVIRLNTDPASKIKMAAYGNNENQIAAARILKAWAFHILTDAYGDIPYTEALQGESILTPKYTPQAEIYADLIKELTEASNQIVLTEPVFTQGDNIYNGDPELWKKFANSLKMRVALRASNVPGWNYRQYIQEAVAAGVFTSNDDNAVFEYIGRAPNNSPLYDAFYTSGRNDFTLSHTFVNLLKGENDVLNGKTNPFTGLLDPRLAIWADPRDGKTYQGMPYGIPSSRASTALRASAINLRNGNSVVLSADLPQVYMDYAEVCFILSEVNNWDQSWYEKGVQASLEYWNNLSVGFNKEDFSAEIADYLTKLPPANQETVLTQKYIAYFLQGYQAWSLIRRTGYPRTVVRPGEFNYQTSDGTKLTFEPLVGNDIPNRLTYPVSEQTLNPDSYGAARSTIGTDAMNTRMWWDVQ
jgi:hypothetical protein